MAVSRGARREARGAGRGARWIEVAAAWNPFTAAVEMLRFAMYGRWAAQPTLWVMLVAGLSFVLAARGYDPQRGTLGRHRLTDE